MNVKILDFKERAELLAQRGIPVIPVPAGSKEAKLPEWQKKATTDAAQIAQWFATNSGFNTGAVAKAVVGGFWFLDCDIAGLKERIESETGQTMPRTLTVETSRNRRHYYFKQTAESAAMGNIGKGDLTEGLFDAQVNNKYVVGPGSIHPSGSVYTLVDDAEIVEAPSWLIKWIKSYRKVQKEFVKTEQLDSLLAVIKVDAGLTPYVNRIDEEISVGDNMACPLHDPSIVTEGHSNRSFAVVQAEDGSFIFRCYHSGCGLKGDVIRFVMAKDETKFPQALNTVLEETYGQGEPIEVAEDFQLVKGLMRKLRTTNESFLLKEIERRYPERVEERKQVRGEEYWMYSIREYTKETQCQSAQTH